MFKVTNPLHTYCFPRISHIMASMSNYAYKDSKEGAKLFKQMGFTKEFIDVNSSQAYVLKNKHDLIFVCRGTEPTDINDIKADLNAKPVMSSTGLGHVHNGFKKASDNVFPTLEKIIGKYGKTRHIYVTGHSLGAAMATLVSFRCQRSTHLPDPIGLFTFGSPKVGLKKYIKAITDSDITHYRFVNNNDLVTSVPPWPYRHFDDCTYINHYGKIRDLSTWQRTKDKFRGMWEGIKEFRFMDGFDDHSIDYYQEHLEAWAVQEEARQAEQLANMNKQR